MAVVAAAAAVAVVAAVVVRKWVESETAACSSVNVGLDEGEDVGLVGWMLVAVHQTRAQLFVVRAETRPVVAAAAVEERSSDS